MIAPGGDGNKSAAALRVTGLSDSAMFRGHIAMWELAMSLLWIIIIGFLAGLIARWLAPGPNTPTGFLLTTALGIAGAFVSTFIGQAIGWYRPDQGAGLIGAIVGALIVLFVWHRLVASNVIGDPGAGPKR